MDLAFLTLLQVLDSIAGLALVSFGLAVIFGMMRVINLAHGEFIMLGGFATVFSHAMGVNLWVAILVVPPIAVGLVGLLVERLIMRHLYGRMIDTMLASWGLSLTLMGLATTFFGNRVMGVSAPLGSFMLGNYSVSWYDQVVLIVVSLLYAVAYVVLRTTRWGLMARATMQMPEMAASLGVPRARVFASTFLIGAALSGLAGGMLAPLAGVVPTMGAAYIAKAFITVISGGASVVVGSGISAILLSTVGTCFTYLTTPVIGDVALLVAAVVLLRMLPTGITGRIFKGYP